MKISLAQLNYHIGNFAENTRKIIETIGQAKAEGADLVVFAELAVCGYPPRDFLEFDDFIDRCEQAVRDIAPFCNDIAAIIGAPSRNPEPRGKELFNSAWFIADGEVKSIQHKTLLPNYDVFDEYRYFEPNRVFNIVEYKNQRIALTICEDLWVLGTEPLYFSNPMEELAKQQPDLIINIAASPFHSEQAEKRQLVLESNAKTYGIPLIYVNQVGAQTELLFDGGSLALNADGKPMARLAFFEEDFQTITLQQAILPEIVIPAPIERIHDALVMGIRDYFRKLGFKKAILGLSGGIDSALVMVLAAEALGSENVLGVLLPSAFSSDHSVTDALELAKNLGCPTETIPIEPAFRETLHSLAPQFGDLPFNIAEENIQARIRAVILMALSNKFGYILLNTSNKSEAAVGYGTLYGDMCGGISVIGDVYKTEVYALSDYINRNREIIPQNILNKPPSAELRPDQKDSDSLPEYDILDAILKLYIEKRTGPKEIVELGYDKHLTDRILRLVNLNEYKRYQTPPILRISSKAFGMGRRLPIVAKYLD
jgi:NAD+ synthase (glutamine-hydrolysing)